MLNKDIFPIIKRGVKNVKIGKSKTGKMSLLTLVLMIFTSVYGFNNIPRAFYLMGYSAIPWYILGAVGFFIPYAFMMAEFGTAFSMEKGGIYSWMEKSIGPKFAFIGTFMWFSSFIVWMVNISSSIWVPLSNVIFGSDNTSKWSLLGLTAPKTLALLGIIFIVFMTTLSCNGLKSIAKIASIGGLFVTSANFVLIIGSIVVLIGNGFKIAQPIAIEQFIHSPNPNYGSIVGILGFLVFSIFAYGGLEAVGGLVDETENAKVNFPRGIKIAAIVIGIGYSLCILMVGFFTNWETVLTSKDVSMANVAYIVIKNLGLELGKVFKMSESATLILGAWFARYIGLAMFLALLGAFFTLSYAPLKQLIEGTPSKIWPKSWSKIDEKTNMPINALWVQCSVVVAIIIIVSFGGDSAAKFLDYLILMSNVSMTIPTMFLAFAFIYFKKNDEIEKPFIILKSKKLSIFWAIIVILTVGFANFFTIIQPTIQVNDYKSTVFQILGPIIFGLIAFLLYNNYEKNNENK